VLTKRKKEDHGIHNCKTEPNILNHVKVTMRALTIICIHPEYSDYPIASLIAKKLEIGQQMLFDHDSIDVNINTMQIIDHTNYPRTFDP
jgi:hypothetical protein